MSTVTRLGEEVRRGLEEALRDCQDDLEETALDSGCAA